MRIASRLTVLATVAVAGLGLTAAIPAAASLTPRARTAATAANAARGTRTASPPAGGRTTTLWVARFENGQVHSVGAAVAASPNGSTVFATGYRTGHSQTIAYNAGTGAQVWQSEYTAPKRSVLSAIAVSPNGSTVFTAGWDQLTATSPANFLTVAYNAATGATLWADISGTSATTRAVAVSRDGTTVFVTGVGSCGKPATAGYLTVAYNAATGATRWTQCLANGGVAASIALSPGGSAVYVTGDAPSPKGKLHQPEYSTVAYNAATGATLWTAQYGIPVTGSASAVAVAASPSGSAVFVTGSAGTRTGTSWYETIAYAASSGTRLWARGLYDPKATNQANSLVVSPDGSTVFVTGGTGLQAVSFGEYSTVAYNATTGATLWTSRYQGPGSGGSAQAISVSPDGAKVFVTGGTRSAGASGQLQYATVAYDSGTGARLWVARYGDVAKGASSAVSVAVSPDGSKVFVTGDNTNHFTTIAYRS